ncbi:DUF2085 domain-containing protein [Ruminococcus sp. AM54-1NS]|nr:DUF2085 domain-containing protein [Ruminococcus sp. AM54-1NS]
MKLGASAGCHQRPDRSFFFHGWQFPVCARCTGVLAGQLVGIPIAIKKNISTSRPYSAVKLPCWIGHCSIQG